jgi:CheY-like chemotaxis protein
MNLAVNARDAMPNGGRLLVETQNVFLGHDYVRTHIEAKRGDYVLLTVSDSGKGMDKTTIQHIFEPFFTTKGSGEGTGLGLATVYGIVQQHDGYIVCYSEPEVGTSFKIYFPAITAQDEWNTVIETPSIRGGSETILVVDDEEFIRDLATRVLSDAGYTVMNAVNGTDALQQYRNHSDHISLVVLDLIMPEMDGKRCLAELLKINPEIKVVVASGYSANGHTKSALELGARGFVSKPFDLTEFLQTIRSVIDENH